MSHDTSTSKGLAAHVHELRAEDMNMLTPEELRKRIREGATGIGCRDPKAKTPDSHIRVAGGAHAIRRKGLLPIVAQEVARRDPEEPFELGVHGGCGDVHVEGAVTSEQAKWQEKLTEQAVERAANRFGANLIFVKTSHEGAATPHKR